jgi:hypothetical protein
MTHGAALRTVHVSAFPMWSVIMILLDVLVIFALTARWDEARAAM